jgi:S-methylmethionine-dependent homocysteine/selenocysteine methylase
MSNARRITILDGGMGHELKLRGISDGTFLAGVLANQSSSNNSDIVESIHLDYLNAGCDVITTNSFVAVSVTQGVTPYVASPFSLFVPDNSQCIPGSTKDD